MEAEAWIDAYELGVRLAKIGGPRTPGYCLPWGARVITFAQPGGSK
jgi:hypothetical protein